MSRYESTLVKIVRKNIGKAHLTPQSKVIIGVSGGADSMALLYLVRCLNIDALVVHINYGKRGVESDKDQELVEGMSFEWGFECVSLSLQMEDNVNRNFQDWARTERYRIFRELKEVNEAEAILVAHHQDDQVETILHRLFRGSGVTAWQGMKVWDGELLRPFLNSTKQDILDYCAQESIPFRVDATNLESEYARNFIRNNFGPQLTEFFPGWETNILALPSRAEITEQAIEALLSSIADETSLKLDTFLTYPAELQKALLKHFVNKHKVSISKGQLKELLNLTKLEVGKRVIIGENLSLVKERERLVVGTLNTSSSTNISLDKNDLFTLFKLGKHSFLIERLHPGSVGLRMDAGKMDWPITIRNWQNGDRIQPFGMKGTQKVSDHLTNLKISTINKEKTLVLCTSDGTIYAIILPKHIDDNRIGTISENVRCTPQTKEYFTINIEQ